MYVESRNESIKLAGSRRRWSGVTDGDGLAYPKRHLEVLAAPDIHSLVVRADLVEVLPVDGEEAAGHGGRPQRLRTVTVAPVHLALRDAIPTEVQLPIKSAPRPEKHCPRQSIAIATPIPLTYMSEAVTYSNVSSEMTSMMGQTTARRLLTISARRGSSHPSVHSQCASRKVSTLPLACLAPNSLEQRK